MKYVVGIDVGTSGCKVILLNETGKVVASTMSAYSMEQPQIGWTEQDPKSWWDGCCEACKELISITKIDISDIAGVGLSGQMHSPVALDKNNNVVRPAILWNDQRTKKQCEEVYSAVGGLEELLCHTNNMMLTGYTAGKLLWIKENEPGNFKKIEHFVLSKDYIRFRLTGVLATDKTDASGTGLFDVRSGEWASTLIEKIGLPLSIFPSVYESIDCTGKITPEGSAASGLPEGIPVFGGGGDAVLSLISAGITSDRQIGLTLGTSGVVAMPMKNCIDNPGGKLQVFCNVDAGKYVAIGCTLAAAGSYKWFNEALGDYERYLKGLLGKDEYVLLDQQAEIIPPGCAGLLYFPYLMGERCPLFDGNVRASFIGIDASMGKGHMARAVLEGVVFSLYQVYGLMKKTVENAPTEVMICGGGSKSPLWKQIVADVFNLPVYCTSGAAEGSAYGAALIAGVGIGFWKNVEEAAATRTIVDCVHPKPENIGVYREQYKNYCELCERVYNYK